MSETDTCKKVAGDEFPDICGVMLCDPDKCSTPGQPTMMPTVNTSCGCTSCTRDVLNRMNGDHSCGDRIDLLQSALGMSETDTCKKVAGDESPDFLVQCVILSNAATYRISFYSDRKSILSHLKTS